MKKYYFGSLVVVLVGFILAVVGAMNGGIKQVGLMQNSLLSRAIIFSDDKQVYTKNLASFKKIKVDTQTADLVIKPGDNYHVKVTDTPNYAITTKVDNNQLVIKEKQRANMMISWGPSHTKVEITVPNQKALKELTGTAQTSKLTLTNLKMDKLDLQQDAGRITLQNVQFSHNFKLHADESRMNLHNSQLQNVQVLADELNLTADNTMLSDSSMTSSDSNLKLTKSSLANSMVKASELNITTKNCKLTGDNVWHADVGKLKLATMNSPLVYSVDQARINYFGQHKRSLKQSAHSVDKLQVKIEDPSTTVDIS
ncbi:DUF4097 family beta strand repeat-containing protein [Bombilactobacillus thymidiniphilus]|uniref:DUF4097 domain-containing protein n=1 Tax=Bombilactobacillus thymidiniphilus TaxID=2923363 RepID=A0ABY4PCE6_9LACO|nr:DUF4097 family beta strand repeat-containing protein [Bombilactobacillus thymidiniphilus]UQS83265.1 DUF4097 domain-containing protein [Bombilactobacillus thymidiniphilus]